MLSKLAANVVAWLMVVALPLLVGIGIGAWAGHSLARGAQAADDNARIQAESRRWERLAELQTRRAIAQAVEYDEAVQRLNLISMEREDDLKSIRSLRDALAVEVDGLRAARPDLDRLDLGADFLRIWNAANAGRADGADAAATRAGAAREPDADLPATADGNGQPSGGDAGPAQPGSAAVPRLPQRDAAPDRSGAGMAGDGAALVPRGGQGPAE